MRRTSRRLALTWAGVALAVVVLTGSSGFAKPVELTIVHFNDLDRMEESRGQGGVARLAAVVRAERARRANVLVTFAGDAISPSLMSAIDKGAHMIELLNKIGLTAMAIGNHEYDFGPEVARQRFSEAAFPVLGANNIDPDGKIIEGARASIMVEVGRFKVGIFGLTTVGTAVKSLPGNITFAPVVETAAAQAKRLRAAGAHLVVALAHTDVAEDEALLRQEAVDLLLSGDDHRLRLDYDGRMLFAESSSAGGLGHGHRPHPGRGGVQGQEAVRLEPGLPRRPYRPCQPRPRARRVGPGLPDPVVAGPRRRDRHHRDGDR